MYYASTSNQHHLPASSVAAIGTAADQANHNYALPDFWNAVHAGNLPAVTFLKAPSSRDRTSLQVRSTVRANVAGRHHQPVAGDALLESHGHLYHLRRFGRLV